MSEENAPKIAQFKSSYLFEGCEQLIPILPSYEDDDLVDFRCNALEKGKPCVDQVFDENGKPYGRCMAAQLKEAKR